MINYIIATKNKICPQCPHHNAADNEYFFSNFVSISDTVLLVSGFQLPMLLIPGQQIILPLFTGTWIVTVTFYQEQKCHSHLLPGPEIPQSLFTRKVTITHPFFKMALSGCHHHHIFKDVHPKNMDQHWEPSTASYWPDAFRRVVNCWRHNAYLKHLTRLAPWEFTNEVIHLNGVLINTINSINDGTCLKYNVKKEGSVHFLLKWLANVAQRTDDCASIITDTRNSKE